MHSRVNYPAASCGALKIKTELLLLLILYIPTDNFGGNLVPNRSNKISIIPQLSAPKLLLDLWEFFEYYPCRHTLQYLHNPSRRISRRCWQKQMHMILIHLHRINLKFIPLRYLCEACLQPLCQIPLQYHLPLLRGPYHVILEIVNRVTCSSNWAHAQLIPCLFAFGEPVFIRPASWVVFNRFFL